MANFKELIKRIVTFFINLSDQTKLTLVVSGLIGIGVVSEWATRLGGSNYSINDPRLLVAIRELEKGTELTQLDLTTVMGTEEEAKKVFNDQQLPIVLGSRLRYRLKRGERLAHDVLELPGKRKSLTEKIKIGFRAYSFQPENDLPLQLGDKIDIVSASEKGVTQGVVSAVEVLDLKREVKGQTLIVAVPEDDLPDLEKARQTGKLVIALRNSQEEFTGPRAKRRKSSGKKAVSSGAVQMLLEEGE